jgi:ribosome-associated heat shock protein Hsp15
MRLDKFLFFVRLTKTRSLAQAIVNTGHVRINGRAIERAHHHVVIGQVITLPLHDQIRVIRVEAIPTRRGPPHEVAGCYANLTI